LKNLSNEQKNLLLESIRDIPDFPKEGILFKDITTLLNDAEAFNLLMNHLEAKYKDINLHYIAGTESRGFIFGASLASKLGIGFVPIRKSGKLPHKTLAREYALEYGTDRVEIHEDAFREGGNVLLIDDLIATGGTAKASVELINETNATCVEACFILSLEFLEGKKELEKLTTIYSVLEIY
jgi:adenine phosphoribosyltransferase